MWSRACEWNISLVEGISELNKRKVRLFVEAVWNEGRLELIDELVAADYLGRFSPMPARVVGREELRRLVASRRRSCPGLHIKIEDQIAEDDRVATRWRLGTAVGHGARSGAGSGYIERCFGISIIRLLAGKQIDSHTEYTTASSCGATEEVGPVRHGLIAWGPGSPIP